MSLPQDKPLLPLVIETSFSSLFLTEANKGKKLYQTIASGTFRNKDACGLGPGLVNVPGRDPGI